MAEIKIAVLGGPGCGKRSLLACMDKAFAEPFAPDKKLKVVRKEGEESFALLDEKFNELNGYFQGASTFSEELPGQKTEEEYHYQLWYANNLLGVDLCVTEIRYGERPLKTPQEIDAYVNAVKNSQIIMLVIDTPAMMEEPIAFGIGKYQELKNPTPTTWKFIYDILQELNGNPNSLKRKFLMLVPVKCEKYEIIKEKSEEQRGSVNRKIKLCYPDLMNLSNVCTSAIVPVQTLGNAVFEKFEEFEDRLSSRYTVCGKQMATQWADMAAKMVLQYVFAELDHYLQNPKETRTAFGQPLSIRIGENTLQKFKKENGANINNIMEKQEIVDFEILSDTVEIEVHRKLSDFNVLMFGPRRAGKSSVLASMLYSLDELEKQKLHYLHLQPADSFTSVYLEEKRKELSGSVDECKEGKKGKIITDDLLKTISMSEAATDTANNYTFNMYYGESQKLRTIDFMDIPGERLIQAEGNWNRWLERELKYCQIVIIAIDTPHLMERKGRYNIAFNRPDIILSRFQNADLENISRLVLMVPIKCEKYYYENKMDDVNAAVKKEYKRFLKFLKKNMSNTIVAITPVLTIGGVVFDSFEVDKDGFVTLFKTGSWQGRPTQAKYKLYEPKPIYEPMFCEQPMIYLLSYILISSKKQGGMLGKIIKAIAATALMPVGELFFPKNLKRLWDSVLQDSELQQAAQEARTALKDKGDGYEIVQGKL